MENKSRQTLSGITKNLDSQKGGMARAEALSALERRAIAQKAAGVRWSKAKAELDAPIATHVGTLKIGDMELTCAVLKDGKRVISERGLLSALGISRGGALSEARKNEEGEAILPLYVAYKNLRPFISEELMGLLNSPIKYQSDVKDGVLMYTANGVDAELIPRICEVWLQARDARVLRPNSAQERVAANADIIIRGLARVGIIALVDEATGYQHDRARNALAKILEEFIAKELRPYIRTFPIEFYQELFRLRNMPFDGTVKSPPFIGTLTNNIIYKRLAPGVLEELKKKNPSNNGRRKNKHFQFLTEDKGQPKLLQHLSAVVVLMKISNTYEEFEEVLNKALPIKVSMPLFDLPQEDK